MFNDATKMEKSRAVRLALTGTLIGIGIALFALVETAPGVADTMGYLYAGRQLAAGHGPVYEDDLNAAIAPVFSPFAFQIRRTPDRRLYLGYPPGQPLLLAAGRWITGRASAENYVVPFLAVAMLGLTFLLGRELFGREAAGWIGALVTAGGILFWEYGTAAWSEIPSAAFILLGVVAYLRVERAATTGRGLAWATLAALALVFSWFIRYTNLLIVPALIVYELAYHRFHRLRQPAVWLFSALLLAGLGGLLLFNATYYGGLTRTSYSPEHGWYPFPAFDLAYALGPSPIDGYSLAAIGRTLWANFSWLGLLLPAGLLIRRRRPLLFLAAAGLCLLAPYGLYAFAAAGVNSRFVLPAVPFLALWMAAGFLALQDRLPAGWPRWLVAGLLAVLLIWPLPGILASVRTRNANQAAGLREIIGYVDGSEPDAVYLTYAYVDHIAYFTGRSVLNYRRIPVSDPVTRTYAWEMIAPCLTRYVDQLHRLGRPVYFIETGDLVGLNTVDILAARFRLVEVRDRPPIYRVEPEAGDAEVIDGGTISCPGPG